MAFEGQISGDSVRRNLQRGDRASGDMIPWTIEQQVRKYSSVFEKCVLWMVLWLNVLSFNQGSFPDASDEVVTSKGRETTFFYRCHICKTVGNVPA